MKQISGIKDYARDINTGDVLSDEERAMLARYQYQQMFTFALAIGQSAQPDSIIEILDLIRKIKDEKSDVLTLEDAEFKLLKDAIESNVAKFPNIFYGQAVKKVRSAVENK